MRKYLVTGIAGFIGSHIAEELLKRGENVVGIDNFYSGKRENIEYLESLGEFSFWENDLRDLRNLERLFRFEKPTHVFHLGAIASVQKSIEDPIFTNAVNVEGTLNILELSREHRIKRIVFSSSAAVYGDEPTLPKDENSVVKPISPYGYEKLMGEQYMKLYNELYGVETVSLRYFNVYGERQDPTSEYSGVISIFENRIKSGDEVKIFGDGEQFRDFIYVKDIVKLNILAMETEKARGETFVCGTGIKTSINSVFTEITEKHQKDISPKYENARSGDIRESLANNSKIREYFAIDNFIKFKKGIQKL
ncbi:UDP-glucose 4-epimerase [Thiovulum sp. ES]|nr:UDP-glucose 4-epimerase [Thiovulum sp. ES]